MEPEYFQYLLLMLVSIGKARPHNLQLLGGLLDNQLAKEMLSQHDKDPLNGSKVKRGFAPQISEPPLVMLLPYRSSVSSF